MKTDKELLADYKERVKCRLYTEDQLLLLMNKARTEGRYEVLSKIPDMVIFDQEFSEMYKKVNTENSKLPANMESYLKKMNLSWFLAGAALVIKKIK